MQCFTLPSGGGDFSGLPVTQDLCSEFRTEARLLSFTLSTLMTGNLTMASSCCGMCVRHREPFTTHHFYRKVSPKSGEGPPGPAGLAVRVSAPQPRPGVAFSVGPPACTVSTRVPTQSSAHAAHAPTFP